MASKLVLLAAMLVGGAIAAYGLFLDKSGQAIAYATAGLFVLGAALTIAGFLLGADAVGRGREGRTGRGLLSAFLGGMCMLAGAGALAGAAVFTIIVLF